MRVAMVGTRGVPARYGGFETAIEEVGQRLAGAGHQVTVYCRGGDVEQDRHLGMELVHKPAMQRKTLETLSHTGLSVLDVVRRRPDAVLLFNAANAPFLPLLRAARIPVATHVDGLEWRRAKWGAVGRRYYLNAERLAVRWSDALIADAVGIQDYYQRRYSAESVLLPYGAPLLTDVSPAPLHALGLESHRYHLVVARFEPENHVLEAVQAAVASSARYPLVVVGGAPYADAYTRTVELAAAPDQRVKLVGPVWDQTLLDALYAHACTYVHGHSVGGTNPSLLRAAGAAAPVSALDVDFNREVLRDDGRYWSSPAELAQLLQEAEAQEAATRARGAAAQRSVAARYDWDDVAKGYEDLCRRLMSRTALAPVPTLPSSPPSSPPPAAGVGAAPAPARHTTSGLAVATAPTEFFRLPPGRRHIWVPTTDRRASMAGLSLYGATRSRGRVGSAAFRWAVRLSGPAVVPLRRERWSAPMTPAEWADLNAQWSAMLPGFDGFAVYERLQSSRTGFALLLLDRGAPVAFVKVRHGRRDLSTEQTVLTALSRSPLPAARTTSVLASGSSSEWAWLALEALPRGAGVPRGRVDVDVVLAGLDPVLRDVLPPAAGTPAHWMPLHGDLTAWNMRYDRSRTLWLFDWEDAGWGPPGADKAYYRATSQVLFGTPAGRASAEVVSWWLATVGARSSRDADARFNLRLADALRSMTHT